MPPFVGERYHARVLATPREVRNCLVYVLMNFKKHDAGARGLDPKSSAEAFNGFLSDLSCDKTSDRRHSDNDTVQRPRTWLLSYGWRRHGLLASSESPRHAPSNRWSHSQERTLPTGMLEREINLNGNPDLR